MARLVLFRQGLYFLVAGAWPLLHMRSFTAITGPKVDLWLVRTVGSLIAVIGAVLVLSSLRRRAPAEIPLLAAGSALALAAIEVVYATKRRISPIYLLDTIVEVAITLLLLVGLMRRTAEDY